ncbi:hypothetical protein [Thiovibrio frasassiensis]|uniref:Uncharacterized protein n=1 Tax=Thiovibrio frasassiensis TaxID=2984131 RepID=A0A9X4MGR8_9BACT|nr:hypothetical protein [Thiovibrio frasassiensis]MDG4475630.1 hypothetical protein [Thiovibrio frasassiensis]
MRCPKCGYISFDRQRSCGKCSNDLTAAAEQITGTVSKAAAPFFLGAVLGKKTPAYDEPSPTLYEEEETLSLDELDAETLPTDEEELDFSGVPLNEDDLDEQPLPSLGLEDIDVSDLIPPQEEKEEALELTLGSEQEEGETSISAHEEAKEEEELLSGIEFSGFEFDDTLSAAEKEHPLGGFEDEPRESPDNEEEEIIDLSSLMDFDDAPAEKEDEHDIMDLSLGEAPEELHLSLEDGEPAPAPDGAAKKSTNTLAEIPDLDLTLENDDQ